MARFLLIAAVAWPLTLLPPVGSALARQDQPASPTPAEPVVNVDFPGGTLAQFVEALSQAAAPRPVNVMLRNHAGEVPVGVVRLRSVDIGTALEAVADVELQAEMLGEGSWKHAERVRLRLARVGPGDGGSPVFIVDRQDAGRIPDSTVEAQRPGVQIFSIGEIIDAPPEVPNAPGTRMTIDQVMSALETVLALQAGRTEPLVRFHEESRLLVVQGDGPQIAAIASALSRIEDSIRGERKRALDVQMQRIELQHELEEAMGRIQVAEARLADASQSLDELARLAETGAATPGEVRAARTSLVELEAAVDSARRRYDLVSRRLSTLPPEPQPEGPGVWVEYDLPGIVDRAFGAVGSLRSLAGGAGIVVQQTGSKPDVVRVWATEAQHQVIQHIMRSMKMIQHPSRLPGDDWIRPVRGGEPRTQSRGQ